MATPSPTPAPTVKATPSPTPQPPADTGRVYKVTASGGKYFVDGEKQKTLWLQKGQFYGFDTTDAGMKDHPFVLQLEDNQGAFDSSSMLSTSEGVSDNGTPNAFIAFAVPEDFFADTVYYRCEHHPNMGGVIKLLPPPSVSPTQQLQMSGVVKPGAAHLDI
jgi:hypothetical protein